MIVAVTMCFGDAEPNIQYVDTNKLDHDCFVDREILRSVEADEEYLWIEAGDWEDRPEDFPNDNVGISYSAIIDKTMWHRRKNPSGQYYERADAGQMKLPHRLVIDRAIIVDISLDC